MDISDFSMQLHELVDDYSSQRITFEDYRVKRKEILDEIDANINGLNLFIDNTSISDKSEELR